MADLNLFPAVVERHGDTLLRFARHLVGDYHAAEDVVSETTLKAYQLWAAFEYRTEGELVSWLLTICRHRAMDRFRNRDQKSLLPVEDLADVPSCDLADPILDRLVEEEAGRRARALVDALPAGDRDLVWLRVQEGLTYAELAPVFGATEAAVKMRFLRLMAKVRAEVERP